MKWCVLWVQNKNNMPTSASLWLSYIAGNKEFRLMWSTRVGVRLVWYRAEIQRGHQTCSDTSACCAFQSEIINANTSISAGRRGSQINTIDWWRDLSGSGSHQLLSQTLQEIKTRSAFLFMFSIPSGSFRHLISVCHIDIIFFSYHQRDEVHIYWWTWGQLTRVTNTSRGRTPLMYWSHGVTSISSSSMRKKDGPTGNCSVDDLLVLGWTVPVNEETQLSLFDRCYVVFC